MLAPTPRLKSLRRRPKTQRKPQPAPLRNLPLLTSPLPFPKLQSQQAPGPLQLSHPSAKRSHLSLLAIPLSTQPHSKPAPSTTRK